MFTSKWRITAVLLAAICWGCSSGENRPPEVNLSVQSQQTYRVGQDVIRVEVSASDPDGDALSFDVTGAPNASRVTFQTFSNSAIFRWNPAPQDIIDDRPHRLTFSVTDSSGAQTDRVFNAYIRPGNGIPTFDTSSSQIHDLASGEPFTFDVRVTDANNESVTLFMESGPNGATFDKTGSKRGEFRWSPTQSQRQERLHSAVFEADDGDNPPVNLEVSLILTDSSSSDTTGGCTDADPYAGNHMRDEAVLAELETYSDMELCPGRPDWFQRTIFAGTTLQVVVHSIDGAPLEDVTLEIVDSQGSSVAEGAEQTDSLTATFTPQTQDQYFVRVAALSEVSYDVTFSEP